MISAQINNSKESEQIFLTKVIDWTISLPVLRPLRVIKRLIDTRNLFRYDRKRYLKNYSSQLHGATKTHLDARLMFHAHALEKGLSHNDFRYGFGRIALNEMASVMNHYGELGFDKSSSSYTNALSVLNEYRLEHEKVHYNTTYLSTIFGDLLSEIKDCDATTGGAMIIQTISKSKNRTKNFKDLFADRYSVREFSNLGVSIKDINEAISISTKSPSVCNRQPARVHIVTRKKTIEAILNIQGGFNGYAIPPVLLLVTSDVSNFLDISERNQAYIDGGAFSMSLLLSLEYVGLAACPLNTMFNIRQNKAICDLMGVSEKENLIMFLAVGHFKNRNSVPKSFRYPVSEIVSKV